MPSLSKMVDISSFASVESILQHTQKDDFAFLTFIILSGIFYNLYIKEKPDPYHHIWFEKPQQTGANTKGADTRDIGLKLEECVSQYLQRSTIGANFAIEERSRHILGLSIWNCGRTCKSVSPRLSKPIWTRCAGRGPVRLRTGIHRQHSRSEVRHLHCLDLRRRRPK